MRGILNRWRIRRDISQEIELYLEEKIANLVESGIPEAEARLRARREFGNPLLLAEESREALGWSWLEHLWQDARYAFRMLRKSPDLRPPPSYRWRSVLAQIPRSLACWAPSS
jgi:hypothetical protein